MCHWRRSSVSSGPLQWWHAPPVFASTSRATAALKRLLPHSTLNLYHKIEGEKALVSLAERCLGCGREWRLAAPESEPLVAWLVRHGDDPRYALRDDADPDLAPSLEGYAQRWANEQSC